MMVKADSRIENAESIPRKNKVRAKRSAQKLAPAICSTAAGYATYASPIDYSLSETGEPM